MATVVLCDRCGNQIPLKLITVVNASKGTEIVRKDLCSVCDKALRKFLEPLPKTIDEWDPRKTETRG